MQLQEVAQEVRNQINMRKKQMTTQYRKMRLPSDEDISRLIKDGYIRDKSFYYHADIGDFIHAWSKYSEDHPSLTIPERFKRWLQTRLRRGTRRHEQLANSRKYNKALQRLRIKYCIPAGGFLQEEQVSEWESDFVRQNEDLMQQQIPTENLPMNVLRRCCEDLAIKFKVYGDWTIVRRHLLYASTLEDFTIDEEWSVSLEGEPELSFTRSATQETRRHALRLFKAIFKPMRQRRRIKLERDKRYYEAVERAKSEGNTQAKVIAALAKEESGYKDQTTIWRIKKAVQRIRKDKSQN